MDQPELLDNCYHLINFDRNRIFELGRKPPENIYQRYCNFPVEITEEINLRGDGVEGFWLNENGNLIVEYSNPYFHGKKIIQGL